MAVELLAGEIKEGESPKAVLACNDFLRMGSGRSLRALEDRYNKSAQKQTPTQSLGTLAKWSTKHDWLQRAAAYDAVIDAEKSEAVDARRREIMEAGLALEHERVNELYEIYAKLKEEFTIGGVWYTDIKLSAKGDQVDVEVFNKPLIDSMRGVLDDLAKETGGRKQKTELEHSGAVGIKVIEGPKDVR